jgi:hypothetical protein
MVGGSFYGLRIGESTTVLITLRRDEKSSRRSVMSTLETRMHVLRVEVADELRTGVKVGPRSGCKALDAKRMG